MRSNGNVIRVRKVYKNEIIENPCTIQVKKQKKTNNYMINIMCLITKSADGSKLNIIPN